MAGEALYFLAVAILSGFLLFEYLLRSRWGPERLWLYTVGERLAFFLWPRPPQRIVKIVMPNGEPVLLYNPVVRERQETVEIETPLGVVRAPEKASTVLPLTAIYVPGIPNPLTLVVYALTGLIFSWLAYYYGYLLAGLEPDSTFWLLAFILMIYIYMWYSTASSAGVEYQAYEITGLAPPYLHAAPSSEIVSPLKAAKYRDQPILIRVTGEAREALNELVRALGVEKPSTAAELLSAAEFYNIILKKAVSLKVKAARVQEAIDAFRVLDIRLGRVTVGKVALIFFVFVVGLLVGLVLGGGFVVGPPPEALAHAQNVGGGVP